MVATDPSVARLEPPSRPDPSATAEFPPLPEPPTLGDRGAALSDASRTAFRCANRWFAVPLHRAGLAALLGTPLSGSQLLLTTTGRRTGRRRDTPLGYYVAEGSAWVLAGYGPSTHWYRNLLADPAVEVLMPGRPPFRATATESRDPSVRARIIPPLARSMGIPGSAIGANVLSASDERILELVAWVPLVRLSPDGAPLVAGPDDPGGLAWAWRQTLLTVLTLVALRAMWRAIRH